MQIITANLKRLSIAAAATAFIALATMGAVATTAAAEEAPAAAPAALTKADVEKIVNEYLMNNGKVIMDAVDKYQRESVQKKSADGISQNKEALFNDDKAPFVGKKDAKIVVVEFFDYNCGYCKRSLPDVQKLVEEDKDVKVIFKDFPILGPTSETGARWALAAHKQGKYFDFHQKLMAHTGAIDEDVLRGIAKEVGMDVDQAAKDAQGTEITMQIEKDRNLGSSIGISGTPAFLVNETFFPGAVGYDQLKKAIDDERQKKG